MEITGLFVQLQKIKVLESILVGLDRWVAGCQCVDVQG